jgi:hypothetical protein
MSPQICERRRENGGGRGPSVVGGAALDAPPRGTRSAARALR